MSAIDDALASSERSYLASKSRKATGSILARKAGGITSPPPDLANATEQLRHFRGWVAAAIRPIASKIAGQKIRLLKGSKPKLEKGNPKPLDSHEVLTLLANPNPIMVAWSLLFTTVASLELTGRCLWWCPDHKAIWPIPTSWITDVQHTDQWEQFRIRPTGGDGYWLDADDCCYFHYPSPADPFVAWSPLAAAASAVNADESIITSQQSVFARGVNSNIALIVGKNPSPDGSGSGFRPHLTDAQQRQIIDSIKKKWAGVQHHGEPLILDALFERVDTIGNSPQEMDYINSGKMTKERVMEIFGVNAIICGALDNANRASAAASSEQFIEFCVNPKINLLSEILTRDFSRMFGQDLQVWIDPCTPRDSEMQWKFLSLAAKYCVLSGDEMRRLMPLDLEDNGKYPEKVQIPMGAGKPVKSDDLAEAKDTLDHALAELNMSPKTMAGYLSDRTFPTHKPLVQSGYDDQQRREMNRENARHQQEYARRRVQDRIDELAAIGRNSNGDGE